MPKCVRNGYARVGNHLRGKRNPACDGVLLRFLGYDGWGLPDRMRKL